jgi:hypothetical protein
MPETTVLGADQRSEGYVGRSWRALGVGVDLLVTDSRSLENSCRVLEEEIDLLDLACSRFRGDSEIAKIDAAGGKKVHISELLTSALNGGGEVTGRRITSLTHEPVPQW